MTLSGMTKMMVAGLILCLAAMSTARAARAVSVVDAGRAEEARMEKVVKAPGAASTGFSVRLPESRNVIFMGEMIPASLSSGDGALPSVDILVSVAALTGRYIREYGEHEKRQAKADEVLAAYQPVLDGYTHRELFQRALEKISFSGPGKLVGFSASATEGFRVEMNPVFTLTQDQSALVLDNEISIHAPGSPDNPVYQGSIRAVSDPYTAPDFVRFWTEGNGAALKEESAGLMAHTLGIAWREMSGASPENGDGSKSGGDGAAHRTFRYRQGMRERMERAQPLVIRCGRALIRTLRGTLMSVPLVEAAGAAEAAESGRCGNRLAKMPE